MTNWNRRVAAATRVRSGGGDHTPVDERLRSLDLPAGLHPDDARAVAALMRLADSRKAGFTATILGRIEHSGRTIRHVQIVVMGNPQGVTAVIGDAEEELETDSVTGLPGRTYLFGAIDTALQSVLRRDHHVGVFVVDIDRFKTLNDRHGFGPGDDVLRTLATRLEATLRPDDTLVRSGGDEFAVVSPDVLGVAEATTIAERLRRIPHDEPPDSPLHALTISVGAAIGRADRGSEELLRDAETALFQAKGRGRDRYEVFDDELRTKAERRVTVDEQLRRAIDDDGIRVHYQPIVEVDAHEVVGVEALLRIADSGGSHLDPKEMVEAAEDAGLIGQIEETIVCRGAAAILALPDAHRSIFLSVNVSQRLLEDSRYPLALAHTLNIAELPADQLHLEINRRVLDSKGAAVRLVSQLRALGVAVVIDEFIGASDAELVVPEGVDLVKLDRRLVHAVHTARGRARAELVVSGLIDRGLRVCAVGVETEADLVAVRELGCTYAQGYYFSPPVDEPQLAKLLAR